MQNKGVMNTMSGIVRTLGDYAGARESARDLGLIKDAISFQHEDLYTPETAYRRFMNISRHVIELAGHGEINRFANTVDMKASQLWLANNLREIQKNPTSVASRMAREIIERRGVDLAKLQAGDIPETRTFLRQWVNDVQTSYRLMDLPAWSKTPLGKLLFQYQPWAYNATRMLFKETINPGLEAFGRGDINLGARYVGRLVYFGAMAVGAEELMKSLREWVFGRESTAPSWSEFFNALHNHNNGLALKLAQGRLVDELVGGTFLGMAGDYSRSLLNYASSRNEVANVWNPNNPPSLSIASSLFDLFNKWKIQGYKLSDRDIANFTGNMFSGWREMKNIGYSANIGLKQVTGAELPIPGFTEAKGYRERAFAQAKFRQFTNDYPDFRPPLGSSPPTPSSAYYSNIEDALYAGDVKRAKALVVEMAKNPATHHDNLLQALRASMQTKQPIPGGNTGAAFFKWAQYALPEDDLGRIQDAQNAFVKAAIDAGIFKANAVKTHMVGATPKKPSSKLLQFNPET